MSVPDYQRRFLKQEVEQALIEWLRDNQVLTGEFDKVRLVPGENGAVFLSLWRKA